MSKKFLLVVNPVSGKKNKDVVVDKLGSLLLDKGIASSVFYTTKDSFKSGELEKEITSGYTDIIVLGGDGTINEVANAIGDKKIPVGIIPFGTSNDFIKNLDIPDSIDEQIDCSIGSNIKQVDVGKCNDRIFLNGVGAGFDGKVVEHIYKNGKKFGGDAAYLYVVLKIMAFFKEPTVSFKLDNGDVKKRKIFLMTIGNGTTFGGFVITPEGRIDDGILDLCVAKKMGVLKRFLMIPKFQKGKHLSSKQIEYHKVREINIEKNINVVAHMDGEFIGNPPFNISVLPAHLHVKVNG